MCYNKKVLKILTKGITKENLNQCKPLIEQQRSLIEKDRYKYWKETKDLIFSNDKIETLVGICYARYYPDKKNVLKRLESIIDDNSLSEPFDIQIKIQAIYDHLREESSTIENKEKWRNFITSHESEFREGLLDNIFGYIETKENKFNEIKKRYNKELNHKNKLWIHIIELCIVELDKSGSIEIISKHINDDDEFVKKVARECLGRLNEKN